MILGIIFDREYIDGLAQTRFWFSDDLYFPYIAFTNNRFKQYVFTCRKNLRQTGRLKDVSQKQLIQGPTMVGSSRFELWKDIAEMNSPLKADNGGFLFQSAFRGDLVEDINERAG